MTKWPENVIGTIVRIINEYEVLAKFTNKVFIDQFIGVFAKTEPIFDPEDGEYIDDVTIFRTRLLVKEVDINPPNIYAILETIPAKTYFLGRKPLNVDPKDIKPIEYDPIIREGDLLIRV